MRKYRWVRLLAVVSVLAIAGAACGGDDDDDDDATDTTEASTDDTEATTDATEGETSSGDRGNVDGQLVIGALLPQSGDLAVIYDALSVPVDMAIEEINAAGGVNGQDVVRADGDD